MLRRNTDTQSPKEENDTSHLSCMKSSILVGGYLLHSRYILRQFFAFCIDREWTSKNPAKALKRPRLLEANDIVPFTSEEIVRIIAACDQIGRSVYERLRSRAIV